MLKTWIVILLHQLIFQGMFVTKNIFLHRKIGKKIRGHNIEATISILFFAFFIGTAIVISLIQQPIGKIQLLNDDFTMTLGLGLLALNLIISATSLVGLKDSWRVGVLEDQKTELVVTGIYRFTRNPYFLSYALMFAAHTIILQNLLLVFLSICGFCLVHYMVLKEEKYLLSIHKDTYVRYKNKVPRYLIKRVIS
ncbi:MAG: isoprenylcysteine carboxylmethyltransferase family protein [Deltaproteobacteria bacterium]|nr:isoprenylcysteine carboxylmethyltransferase family protein [Deltaproteobacteria bacterium]